MKERIPKVTKRLSAMLAAVMALVLCLGMLTFAAEITVNAPEGVTASGMGVNAYKILDLANEGTGNQATYTVTDEFVDFFAGAKTAYTAADSGTAAADTIYVTYASGAMGSIDIPSIGVDLVIYHGTEEETLQKGVGHLQGSSLPTGGIGTHCILSAHTGLSDKKLFTDLDQLEEGDQFYIHILGEIHAYQVDQIKVVLPDETEDLQINAQEDYVTLVTCTPYGINTHRLLVRGVRVPYVEQTRENEAEKLISEQKNTTLISRFAETDKENYTELLRQMEKYNTGIYENGQSGLKDAWSYAQNPFDFDTAGLPDDMIGYITIEAMNEKLPLYIGANEENMSKGAVVMGQTSMPIGGENTNCVIAAHRGYRGIPMFQYIEVLQPGDKVEITNLWETLEYEVVKSIVIYPDNIDAVKIIPGEDMLTLITCHPYTQNYQRYVVYCRRAGNGDEYAQEAEDRNPIMNIEGADYESSEKDIEREQLINRAGMIAFLAVSVVFISVFLIGCRKKRRKKKK